MKRVRCLLSSEVYYTFFESENVVTINRRNQNLACKLIRVFKEKARDFVFDEFGQTAIKFNERHKLFS
jgi:hypothetical protein